MKEREPWTARGETWMREALMRQPEAGAAPPEILKDVESTEAVPR